MSREFPLIQKDMEVSTGITNAFQKYAKTTGVEKNCCLNQFQYGQIQPGQLHVVNC